MSDKPRIPSLSANRWTADVTAYGRQEQAPPPPPETELDRMVRRMHQGVSACHEQKAYVSCATLIFTNAEALGGFLIGSEQDLGRDSQERLAAFLTRYMKVLMERIKSAAEYAKRNPADYPAILYKKFRCGLIHEYIMKEGVALTRTEPFVQSPYVQITPEYELILNIDDLKTEFCTAVAAFKQDARENPDVRGNYERRIAFLEGRATVNAARPTS